MARLGCFSGRGAGWHRVQIVVVDLRVRQSVETDVGRPRLVVPAAAVAEIEHHLVVIVVAVVI